MEGRRAGAAKRSLLRGVAKQEGGNENAGEVDNGAGRLGYSKGGNWEKCDVQKEEIV